MSRRSLKWPITLGVVMIVLLVLLILGWVVLAVVGVQGDSRAAAFYVTALVVGTVLLVLVLVGVVMYLALSIKAINLGRRQSNFIDSVTHELKSPIASLKLYLQTLNRRHVPPEEQASFYRYMLEDVERLDLLFTQLLTAAKLEKDDEDGAAEEPTDVDLAELLRQCVESTCPRYGVAAEVVRMKLDRCVVRARHGELDVIFRNLIDNALKYAGTPPEVAVSLRRDDDAWAVVRISDNGAGIPRNWRHKVFQRFVRLGIELQRKKPGTGLGLYLVRTFVRRLRGKVQVFDRKDGPGTVFQVRLPALPVAEAGEAAAPDAETTGPPEQDRLGSEVP